MKRKRKNFYQRCIDLANNLRQQRHNAERSAKAAQRGLELANRLKKGPIELPTN